MDTLPDTLPADPLPLFASWFADAQRDSPLPNPDAMALATLGADGQPSVRIVLCKQVVVNPGYVVFYTNYESAKGDAIAGQPKLGAVFHWDTLNRQVRIEGTAVRSPASESDAYFASRDRDSRIGAWASAQSRSIDAREELFTELEAVRRRFPGDSPVPRPPFWGGYRIWISAIEFWVRGEARLHDRGRWQRSLHPSADEGFSPGPWRAARLQP